jgi:hypothetical protein
MAAELLQEIIVDAQHLIRCFAVVEPRSGIQNAIDDLGP